MIITLTGCISTRSSKHLYLMNMKTSVAKTGPPLVSCETCLQHVVVSNAPPVGSHFHMSPSHLSGSKVWTVSFSLSVSRLFWEWKAFRTSALFWFRGKWERGKSLQLRLGGIRTFWKRSTLFWPDSTSVRHPAYIEKMVVKICDKQQTWLKILIHSQVFTIL